MKKSVFDSVGQPLNLNPPASPNLKKLSCFGANKIWFKFRAPPYQIPDFSNRLCSFASPAKLNLSFRVLHKRPDGYHEIASLFQAIDLFDRLFFSWAPTDQITCTDPRIPTNSSNLVSKALTLFRSRFPIPPIHIHIEKKIPIEAGLGGGSSNAATTLWALNELTHRPATLAQLIQLGSTLGSDIPFFFSSGTAYCTGRGEIMQPRSHVPLSGWIAKPHYGLSTPLVYQNTRIEELPPRNMSQEFFNDLEVPAFRLEPRLIELKNALQTNFQRVVMTGSGTAFFCLEGVHQPIDEVAFTPFRTINRSTDWYSCGSDAESYLSV